MKKIRFIILSFLLACQVSSTAFSQNLTVQNILNDVRIDSMTFFVKQLSGEVPAIINGLTDTIKSRHKDQPGNEKAFQYIKQKFMSYGLQADSFVFSLSGKNSFGIKQGYKFPNKKFIIGAHYDNMPVQPIAPGADDNASGTAAVIEAARVFSQYSFPFTIVFALWDEEEQGLIGSSAYVSQAAADGDSIIGYINLDMLGWDGNNDNVADLNVRPVANSLQLADRAINSNTLYNIGLSLHVVNPGNGSTDHAPFWNNGFTAIGLDEEYDNDFNPYWHTPADSLGQFNIPYYEKVAKLAYATLAEVALDTANILSVERQEAEAFPLKIYPNPFGGNATISYYSPAAGKATIEIYNTLGMKIAAITEEVKTSGIHSLPLNMNTGKGVYYLTVNIKSSNTGKIFFQTVKIFNQ